MNDTKLVNQAEITKRDKVLDEASKYTAALKSYAFGLLRDHSRAEDTVQEAFIVVLKKYADFTEGTSMYSWCRSIVRFKVLENIKAHAKVVPMEESELIEAVDEAFEKEQSDPHAEQVRIKLTLLMKCIEKLPAKYKNLLTEYYIHKKTWSVIANELQSKLESVKKNLFRVRVSLKKCVSSSLGSHE